MIQNIVENISWLKFSGLLLI